MFMTRPNDRYPLPQGLAEPGADYWRSLNLATNAAWYILTVRPPTDEYLQTTVLVRWDTDIADAIEASQLDIASLLCIAPPTFDGDNDGWTSFAVAEVWRATNPDEDDNPCVLFVSDDGREHSGLFGETKTGLVKTRLLARVNRSGTASNDAVGRCD
jgi:hypothetical protein